jgi:hypothetical protein
MNVCRSCKHFFEVFGDDVPLYKRCGHPNLRIESPVLGLISASRPADEIRDDVNRCGPEGQWFEDRA